ncbi:membrane protein [Cronobacter phage vB_CsaM_GAP32]|uniref:Putative membrane protein n=1 Tax=Cronobacter phage vB_CsaM_GAP32 TaxID=1141136 RepID=K4F7V3_9CAUD|nr:membrane protein [Cronobacter phage vB_CsaM_GAP32]AFC21987.1 putative membrane protein [Cronobacter phage vB_CsaM_GAP32]
MNSWDKFMSFAFYISFPTQAYIVFYIFMLVMWLFATDLYDKFRDAFLNDDSKFLFLVFLGLSVINVILGYFITWENPINYILNIVMVIYLTILIGIFIYEKLQTFHNYCRRKRGK